MIANLCLYCLLCCEIDGVGLCFVRLEYPISLATISDPNNSKKVFQDVKPDKIMNYFVNNTLKVSYNFLTILKV